MIPMTKSFQFKQTVYKCTKMGEIFNELVHFLSIGKGLIQSLLNLVHGIPKITLTFP